MKEKKWLAACLALCLSGTVAAQSLETISEQEATRIISTLSHDDMQGRASFTPGIEKAADFISAEFQKIGLQPLAGGNGTSDPAAFRQSFKVYRITPATVQASVNGKALKEEQLFASTSYEKIDWKKSKDRQVILIKEGDNARKAFSEANKLEQDALVLVHPSHKETFAAYRRYLTRGVKQQAGTGSSKVFVLTDQQAPKKYKISITNRVEQLPLANVVGMIEGKRKNEIVVFSGHYDHIGIGQPVDGDSIANGADDDASGTTAMMLLARYYKQQPQPERTLVFAAFTAEEIGGFGSRHFSSQLNPDQIVAMFNIEMVGKPSRFGANSAYLTGFEKSDLGKLLQARLQGTAFSIHPDPYPEQNLFYRSDNATLARLGVPAHTISSVQIDKDDLYHTVNDEVESLDMAHLTSMIRAVALAAQGVVNGTDTPTRVDKALVE